MERAGSDKEVMSRVAVIMAVLAMVVASIALVAAFAERDNSSASSTTLQPVAAQSAHDQASSSLDVTLQEFQMITNLDTAKAGKVTFHIHNGGTMTHEMVLVRAPSAESLPLVTVAGGERAVGDVDEEAIPEANLPGEATAKVGKTVTKTIELTPGTYVMICNIDDKNPDGSVTSHFQRGMHAVFTVV